MGGPSGLLVIAEPDQQALYRTLLPEARAVQTLTLDQARAGLPAEGWEIMILDCGLATARGLALLESVKQRFPARPVLFVTEASSEEDAIAAFRLGARDYWRKPVLPGQLQALLARLQALRHGNREQRERLGTAAEKAPPAVAGSGGPVPPAVHRAVDFIHANLHRPLTLETLARAAGTSKYHFARLFRQTLGSTPLSYVGRARINRAAQLLKRSDLSVSGVAHKLGFRDAGSFSKLFRSITGMTPTAWRRAQQPPDGVGEPPGN